MEQQCTYTFDIGNISITQSKEHITHILFAGKNLPPSPQQQSPLLKETARQLQAYFQGRLHNFDLPLAPCGTAFQQKVWKALQNIPYGETRTYKEIAIAVGQAKAARAVGNANNKNPIAIIIPCHRVIGVTGKLVGYAAGLPIKAYLLALEQSIQQYKIGRQCIYP